VNVRTLHKLLVPVPFVFGLYFVSFIALPMLGIRGRWILLPGALLIAYGILGGVLGIMAAFGWLRLGCPFCGAASKVKPLGRAGMQLHCPHCGRVLTTNGKGFSLRCEKLDHHHHHDASS